MAVFRLWLQLIVVTDGCHDVARGTVAVNIGRGFVCGIGDVVGMDAEFADFFCGRYAAMRSRVA